MTSPSDPTESCRDSVAKPEILSRSPSLSLKRSVEKGGLSVENANSVANKALDLKSTQSLQDPEESEARDQHPEASIEGSRNEEDEMDAATQSLSSSYYRRGGGPKRKKVNLKKRKQQEKSKEKLEVLMKTLKPIAFVPDKTLDFSRHEKLLKKLGLWDFVHLEFDQNIRQDLVAKLIAYYSPQGRCSYVNEARIKISRADLARALKLPKKKDIVITEEEKEILENDESIKFIEEILSTWVILQRGDMWIMPAEVYEWGRHIKQKQLEKIDWADLLWLMVEKELKAEPPLGDCFFASHMQLLIKSQKENLLWENSEVGDDDDDDVKEVNFMVKSPKDDCLEVKEEDVGGADLTRDDGATDSKEDKYVEEPMLELNLGQETVSEMVAEEEQGPVEGEPMDVEVNKKEEDEKLPLNEDTHAGSQFLVRCNLSNAREGDEEDKRKGPVEMGEGDEENKSKGPVEMVEGDEEKKSKGPVEMGEGDEENESKGPVEMGEVDEENESKGPVEMGEGVEENESKGPVEMGEGDEENESKGPVEMGEGDEENESKGPVEMGEGVEENKSKGPVEMVEDEPIEDVGEEETEEDKEKHEGGFHFFGQENDDGVGQENLMLGDASPFGLQIHGNSTSGDFLTSRVDMHMVMGSGSCSLFGNGNNKREIDHENDITYQSHNPGSKRLRSEEPTWDEKAPPVETCMDHIEYWAEKARLSFAEKDREREQSVINQQYLMNEIQRKDEMIQHLERNKFEEQQRKDIMIYRLESELRMMTSVVEGYRKALKATQKASREHRKRCPLRDDKPVYKDVKGSGGLVLSTCEIEKLRVKQEAEDRVTRAVFKRQFKEFENEWVKEFKEHMNSLECLNEKLIEVEKEVKIWRETHLENKNHEASEVAPATEET